MNSGAVYTQVFSYPGSDEVVYSLQPYKNDEQHPYSDYLQELSDNATDGSAQLIVDTFSDYVSWVDFDGHTVSLSSLALLHIADVMAWHGHGGYSSNDGSYMCTGEFYGRDVYSHYKDDFDRGRIININGRLCITGGFIEKHCKDMTGNFYYLGTCSSGRDMVDGISNNFELAQAFINKGATAVIANTSTITTTYNTEMERAVFEQLCAERNLMVALSNAKEKIGQQDPNEWDGRRAEVRIFPANNATASNYTLVSYNSSIAGSVKSASTGSAVSNALVRIYTYNDELIASGRTDASGSYSIPVAPGNYIVKVSAGSYKSIKTAVTVAEGQTVYNETFLLVGASLMSATANGIITNAVTGTPVSGVRIRLRANWNNTTGAVVYSTTTNQNGYYEVSGAAGAYTMEYYKSGYVVGYKNIIVMPLYAAAQNAVISPVASDGVYRIVLTWGQYPADLDSHYIASTGQGGRDHVYYSAMTGNTANLDRDDTTSYGPETITVTDFSSLQGGFRYSVHDYSNRNTSSSAALSNSGASVRVYYGNDLLNTYNVPSNRGGTVWNVFSIDSQGLITLLNTFEYESTPSAVGQ